MFTHAIVRRPARSLVNGISSNPQLGKPDYAKALLQHHNYIQALKQCGVNVHVLEADERYPDSCFVEDVAVCTKSFALVTRPGAQSRKGEECGIVATLKHYYSDIVHITEPGTLEGGDVMMVGDHYFIGLSERTNLEGAQQFIAALQKRDMDGSVVVMQEMLHLKTGLAYLEDHVLLVAGEFVGAPEFKHYNQIEVESDEGYAANCIRVNDYVIVPAGYKKIKASIEAAGMRVLTVDTSEYRKIDGGLSCLSLRF